MSGEDINPVPKKRANMALPGASCCSSFSYSRSAAIRYMSAMYTKIPADIESKIPSMTKALELLDGGESNSLKLDLKKEKWDLIRDCGGHNGKGESGKAEDEKDRDLSQMWWHS
ncbi:unnamed protein product [Fraxinus pennsylvanica]|uniref:Uncharacterized protein n=1 Tax=Fraxinus pennsylvanica TaxID=56036 RepID=A0AAD2DKQ9_9LAMI|nr:unnamed protein product [Fraxinus pennsylvanica]